MRVPLFLVVAAGRLPTIRKRLELQRLHEEDEEAPSTSWVKALKRHYMLHKCVAEAGEGKPPQDTWAIPGYPSAGDGGRWEIYIVLSEDHARVAAKKLWSKIRQRLNEDKDLKRYVHVLTPARFKALAPKKLVEAVCPHGVVPLVIYGDPDVTLDEADDDALDEPG